MNREIDRIVVREVPYLRASIMNGCKPAKSDLAGSVKEREYRADVSRNGDLKRTVTQELHSHWLFYCCPSSVLGVCTAAAVATFN